MYIIRVCTCRYIVSAYDFQGPFTATLKISFVNAV